MLNMSNVSFQGKPNLDRAFNKLKVLDSKCRYGRKLVQIEPKINFYKYAGERGILQIHLDKLEKYLKFHPEDINAQADAAKLRQSLKAYDQKCFSN